MQDLTTTTTTLDSSSLSCAERTKLFAKNRRVLLYFAMLVWISDHMFGRDSKLTSAQRQTRTGSAKVSIKRPATTLTLCPRQALSQCLALSYDFVSIDLYTTSRITSDRLSLDVTDDTRFAYASFPVDKLCPYLLLQTAGTSEDYLSM